MQTYSKQRGKKRTTKQEILDYYHALAYPDQAPGGPIPVPVEMRMKAFASLLQWQGITPPAPARESQAPQKFIIEVKTAE